MVKKIAGMCRVSISALHYNGIRLAETEICFLVYLQTLFI
jgi:hypothetical protein